MVNSDYVICWKSTRDRLLKEKERLKKKVDAEKKIFSKARRKGV